MLPLSILFSVSVMLLVGESNASTSIETNARTSARTEKRWFPNLPRSGNVNTSSELSEESKTYLKNHQLNHSIKAIMMMSGESHD